MTESTSRPSTGRRPGGRAPAAALLLASLAAVAAWTPSAAAQENPPDTADALPVTPLTVTILRAPEEGAAAYAVSALDADDLRLGKAGAFLHEALALLPGVQVQNRFNYAVGERLAVRGFGGRAQFGVRGVKVMVDGIPATMADGQSTLDHLDLATLGRAEVLRGPGSALYGNAAGGVLVLRSAVPGAGPVRPEGRVVVGSDGLVNATARAEGWIGATALTASTSRLTYDGFRSVAADPDRTYGEADRWLFNGQAVAPAGAGTLRVTLNAVTFDAENPGSLPLDSLANDRRTAWGGNIAQGTSKDVDQAQLGAVWDGPLAGGRAEAALWGLGREVVNPIPPEVIDLSRRAGGLRVLWGSEPAHEAGDAALPLLTWGAGVEAEVQRDDRKNFANEGGEPGALGLDQLETVRSTGGFVRAGVRAGDRVRVTGALRYDRFRFEADDRFVQQDDGDPDDSGSRTLDAWSPTLGVVVDAGRDVEAWANVATAIETPTTTELANRPEGGGGFNPDLEAQRSLGFEAGVRGAFAEGRLRWELVGFRIDLEDELVPFETGTGRVFYRNAGSSSHEGLEVVLDARLGGGVDATLVYSHTDARFEAYEVDGEDFAGNRVPGLAPNRLRARLGQERPRLFWAVDAEWTDEVPTDDANRAAPADAYWLVGARAGLRDLRAAGLVLSPFAGLANLLDERYTASVAVNAFGGRYYEPGPGRTGYVGLSLGWDRR